MQDKYNIFICYRGSGNGGRSNLDGKFVGLDIYSELQKVEGFKCFFAPKHYKHHDDFKYGIPKILDTVKVALLVLTEGFFDRCDNEDDIVKQELDEILKRDIAIIPIFVDKYNIENDRETINRIFGDEELIDKFFHKSGCHYTGIYDFKGDRLSESIKDIFGCYDNNIENASDVSDKSILSKIGYLVDSSSVTVVVNKLIELLDNKLYYELHVDMDLLYRDVEQCIEKICNNVAHFSVLKSIWTNKLSGFLKKKQNEALQSLRKYKDNLNKSKSKVSEYAEKVISENDGILTFSQSQYVVDFLSSAAIPAYIRRSCTVYICEGRSKCGEPFEDSREIYEKLEASNYGQRIMVTDCSIYQLIQERKINKIILGACAVKTRNGILTSFVNSAGTEIILMLAEKHNIPVYIVSDSNKHLNSFRCRELQLAIKKYKEEFNSDIDAVDYVDSVRPPNLIFVSEKGFDVADIAKYYYDDISKDKRRASTTENDKFIKCCDKTEYDIETSILHALKQSGCKIAEPVNSIDRLKQLEMERIKGVRLFELFVVLDEIAREGHDGALALKKKLLARCNVNQENIINELTKLENLSTLPPYPISKIKDMLLNLFHSIFMFYPNEEFNLSLDELSADAQKIYDRFISYAKVPFRDSTIKNMALNIESLDGIDNIFNDEKKESMKEQIVEFLKHDSFDNYDIIDFDFSSCKNLTTQYDDFVGLNMHESTYNSDTEAAVIDRFAGNEEFVISLFVRYLRFAGRKRLYRVLNPTFHRVRFRYDNERFYFKKFIYLVDILMPSFKSEYPAIYALFDKLSKLPYVNPTFDMITTLYDIDAKPWLGLWKPE